MTHHHESHGRPSAFKGLLKILNLSTSPTVLATADDENLSELDEPPDSKLQRTQSAPPGELLDRQFVRSPRLPLDRKESLLTRALMHTPETHENIETLRQNSIARGISAASMYSTTSTASTAELSSDGSTSPARSATPSPPLPPQYTKLPSPPPLKHHGDAATAAISHLSTVAEAPEAKVEANLGRKRCITFACGRKSSPKEAEPAKIETPAVEPLKRRCTLTFACPSRNTSTGDILAVDSRKKPTTIRSSTPPLPAKHVAPQANPTDLHKLKDSLEVTPKQAPAKITSAKHDESEHSEAVRFHEFASSNDEDDAWVNETLENKSKITMSDCMKKENAIRQIGEEAEAEAEQDEKEAEELEEEYDDAEQEDDFAPSDGSSDGGNESDNEEGFAESDDESDIGSDDLFWAPSTATAMTSTDHLDHLHRPFGSRRGSSSSVESAVDTGNAALPHPVSLKYQNNRRPSKIMRMRPGTPDLPDSTDFVCGTLDEDRPLEAAYISCREQKKQAKHVPIPQDIDPSFPTTDPEDNGEDEEDEIDDGEEPQWLKGQFDEVDSGNYRGRRKSTAGKRSPNLSPRRVHSPTPKMVHSPAPKRIHSPAPKRIHSPAPKRIHSPAPKRIHSPAPKPNIAVKHNVHGSPPSRRLFGQSPQQLLSPRRTLRLKSPPGTRRMSLVQSPDNRTPVGITITRLAQRPNMTRTASLPHTPNPFFRNYREKRREQDTVTSTTPTSGIDVSGRDMHVRGPVDIVIGLEKKRQKRKEKFWRQHCRKYAKEQAERKPPRGKGAERMRELGLECAERNKGYALGQQAQLVLSL